MKSNQMPQTIEVLVKGSIDNLIKDQFDGVKRVYLIQNLKKKRDLLLYIIGKLQKVLPQNNKFVFEAKYYIGYRNKRIDIAIWNGKTLFLCKLVNQNAKIDNGAIYLDLIINNVKQKLHIKNIAGCIICKEIINKNSIVHIKRILTNRIIFLSLKDIFKTVKINSLFDVVVV